MHLDTDILLALIKKEDWLKPHIDLKKVNKPKTSVFAVIEAEIILLREYSRENVFDSVHAAYSALKEEEIISTDNVFDDIKEIEKIDPRTL